MRSIGNLKNEEEARLFSDYLSSQEIENIIREDDSASYSIWVISENDLEAAGEMLEQFKLNPTAVHYQSFKGSTHIYEMDKARRAREEKSRTINMRAQWSKSSLTNKGNITIALLSICFLVAIVSRLGDNMTSIKFLYITDFHVDDGYPIWGGLNAIQSGQLWRLVTPIFLHFGFFHLVFNMLWLYDLGNIIENRHGPLYLLLMVIIVAVFSNLAQFYVSGPLFGGMSGVVYGLLGFLWIRGKYDYTYHVHLHPHIVAMMVLWFVIGLTGLLGNMANTVHGVGLGIGMAWGYLSSHHWTRFFPKKN